MREKSLEIAPSKSETIILSRKFKLEQINVRSQGEPIEIKETVKYLGVHIDRRINSSSHMKETTEKASWVSHNLNRNLPRTYSAESKRKTIASVAWSIVSYCSSIWQDALSRKRNVK